MERVVPQVRLKMAGLDAGGKRARTQPEAAAAAPAQARAPLALRDANAVAERPAKQSKAAELPPGWSTRLSSTTGKPVWEYKEFGLRLDSGPPTLLRDGVPHIHYTRSSTKSWTCCGRTKSSPSRRSASARRIGNAWAWPTPPRTRWRSRQPWTRSERSTRDHERKRKRQHDLAMYCCVPSCVTVGYGALRLACGGCGGRSLAAGINRLHVSVTLSLFVTDICAFSQPPKTGATGWPPAGHWLATGWPLAGHWLATG